MNNYLDYFLEQRMNSVDGEEIKGALEAISIEEKKCLELFKIQISHSQQQLALIGERITTITCLMSSHSIIEIKQ